MALQDGGDHYVLKAGKGLTKNGEPWTRGLPEAALGNVTIIPRRQQGGTRA